MGKRTCTADDCNEPVRARDHCGTHLARIYRNGNAELQRKPAYEERYWAKVDLNGPVPSHQPHLGQCWLWTAGTTRFGYGAFGGTTAHRIMMQWVTKEPIGRGLQACHHCDTPRCIRPSHLFLGTSLDNMHDKIRKGRQFTPGPNNPRFGEDHPQAKVTERDVTLIRRLAATGVMQSQLSEAFDVSPSLIRSIVDRRIWKHVA